MNPQRLAPRNQGSERTKDMLLVRSIKGTNRKTTIGRRNTGTRDAANLKKRKKPYSRERKKKTRGYYQSSS